MTVAKPAGTASWSATLYYQTVGKELIEFLRDEINGTGTPTLTSPTPSGEPQAYIIQTDPFFANLKGWGYAMWDLWLHNGGSAPVAMASAGMEPLAACDTPGTPQDLMATGGRRKVTLSWMAGTPAPVTGGYNIYYDQAGKVQYRASVPYGTTTYTDSGLSRATEYCYRVTAWDDCNGNGVYDAGIDKESGVSNIACATTN
ncbi:MAG TPA: fibronectin type III domain-containing protein [Geopsychrobacteraceae bacterium]